MCRVAAFRRQSAQTTLTNAYIPQNAATIHTLHALILSSAENHMLQLNI